MKTSAFPPLAPLASLWRHRELFRRLVVRDIQSAFRGSVLGLAWIVLIPLALVAIYTFVFGTILRSTWAVTPRTPQEVPLIFFAGLAVFGFFMEVVTRSATVIRDNRAYVTKIIFPVDILAWMLVATALFKLAVNFVLLLAFMAFVSGGLPSGAVLVPVLLLPFILLTVGIAWLLAGIGAFLRDLAHALLAIAPVLMFVSPVFYSVAQIPEAYRTIYAWNPLTFVLEGMRGLLFFDRTPDWRAWLVYCLTAAVVFLIGHFVFNRLRPGFADVV